MITSKYIQNTFLIKHDNKCGSCFKVIKTKKYSYLITAKHVISKLKDNDIIKIYFNNPHGWYDIKAIKILHCDDTDISIFVFDDSKKTSVTFQLPMSSNHLICGQDIFILGFPLEITQDTRIQDQESSTPLPLIKKGALSGITPVDKKTIFYVDIHINQGFSGGPALFKNQFDNEIKIFGVVSSYICDQIKGKNVLANSGIGLVECISSASKIIEQARKELQDT